MNSEERRGFGITSLGGPCITSSPSAGGTCDLPLGDRIRQSRSDPTDALKLPKQLILSKGRIS